MAGTSDLWRGCRVTSYENSKTDQSGQSLDNVAVKVHRDEPCRCMACESFKVTEYPPSAGKDHRSPAATCDQLRFHSQIMPSEITTSCRENRPDFRATLRLTRGPQRPLPQFRRDECFLRASGNQFDAIIAMHPAASEVSAMMSMTAITESKEPCSDFKCTKSA